MKLQYQRGVGIEFNSVLVQKGATRDAKLARGRANDGLVLAAIPAATACTRRRVGRRVSSLVDHLRVGRPSRAAN